MFHQPNVTTPSPTASVPSPPQDSFAHYR